MTSPTLAEFFGIMIGDGCLSHAGKGKNSGIKYIIYICGHKYDDRDYFDYIKEIVFKLFEKEINIQKRKIENAIFIRFSDKKIFQNMKELGFPVGVKYDKILVPEWIKRDRDNIKAFLRGVFDTDGCFILSKQHRKTAYYPRIEIATKSSLLAQELVNLLRRLEIKSSLNRKLDNFRIEIAGRERCIKWMGIIGSKNPKHINKYHKWHNSQLGLHDNPKATDC